MSVDQDVGRCEFWDDWDAVRNKRKIDEVPLVYYQHCCRDLVGKGRRSGLTKAMTSFATQHARHETVNKEQWVEEQTMGLTPSS